MAAALLVVIAVSAVVGVPAERADSATSQGAAKAQWTILAYANADASNIEQSILEDTIAPLASVDLGDAVNVIALVDRTADQFAGPLLNLPDFTGAKLLKAEDGRLTELEDVGEVDMGDGQTLAWFVAENIQRFPAEHYALFMMDHGGGLDGAMWDVSSPTPDGDESHLELDEITEALQSALDASRVDRLDLVAYAACLMATYDAAAKLAPFTDFMLASEEVSIGPQWNESDMLQLLEANPAASALDLAKTFVDLTDKVEQKFPGELPSRTMSVVDLQAVTRVGHALDSFAAAVEADLATGGPALGQAQAKTLHFGTEGSARDTLHLYDLGDLLANLPEVSPAITTARNALYESVKRAVVAETHGEVTSRATGLSLYFPKTTEGFARYPQVAASQAWARMLDAYYKAAGAGAGTTGDAPAFTSTDAQLTIDARGVLVVASLVPGTEAGVTEAYLLGGIVLSDGSIEYVYDAPAVIGAGGPQNVAQAWTLSGVQLTDGTNALDTTLTLSNLGEALLGSVPVLYQTVEGDQTEASLRFLIAADGSIEGPPVLFQFDENGGASAIEPAPGSVVAPLVLVVPPGGTPDYQLASTTGLDASNLTLVGAHLPSGSRFAVALLVSDAAGNLAIATGTDIVP